MKDNSNEVQQGFRYQDEIYLRKYDNAAADPEIQIFTNDTLDDEEPVTRRYSCAICKGKLMYMKHTETIWKCDECQEIYDTEIQDISISKKGFKVIPHHDIARYPKIDDEDINIPFIKSINIDDQQDSNIEILRQSGDKRIQYIRIKGSLAEALSAVNEMDGKY